MASYFTPKKIFFAGIPISKLEFTDSMDITSYTRVGNYKKEFCLQKMKPTLSVSFLVENKRDYSSLASMEVGKNLSIASLGDVSVCAHCGFSLRPGALFCVNCTSRTSYVAKGGAINNLASIILLRMDRRQISTGITDCSLVLQVDTHIGMDFFGSSVITTFDGGGEFGALSNKWICAYCHRVNEKSKDHCDGCSAGQLPYAYLSKLESTCLYCGTYLIGNTVCKSCGNGANGYISWLPRMHQ